MTRLLKKISPLYRLFYGTSFKIIGYGAIALITFFGVYFVHGENIIEQKSVNLSWNTPVSAQRLTPEIIALQIYEQIPEIPKNNQYISIDTGEVASQHTLISRFIRYHEFIKSRPTTFRLDWKLTLADYLGYNETMNQERYPGFSTLTQNPFNEDRELIKSLTRKQRNQLVDLLVSIYQPPTIPSEETTDSPPTETPSSDNNNTPSVLPRRGGANLLMP
ncbi:MAG: hypothetical protein ACXITR_05385 [Cyanobacterium sp.]